MKEIEKHLDTIRHGASGKGGTGTGAQEEQQSSKALNTTEDLGSNLMERVCDRANLNQAYKRVKGNRGSAGVDGMTVDDLASWIKLNKEPLIASLLDGTYQPQPVREVEIPKPGKTGEVRKLGIPTVIDRVIQQAIHQVLEPILDPTFSNSSYGFRSGRGAHDAVKQAQSYVKEGYIWVVDIDVEKFFDRVNHDILMSKIARIVKDKRLLKIIRRFLTAGIMSKGLFSERTEGTPQGGPLSPLLSNIMLDELDKELEKREHKFCRYADDQNIYVKSKKAGERVFQSIKQFLERRLRLKINESKSKVALSRERKFLGFRIQTNGRISIAPESIKKAKDRIRKLTWRNQGNSIEHVISKLNSFLIGWIGYFHLGESYSTLAEIDAWNRRKLRCYLIKQKKRNSNIAKFLISRGVALNDAWKTVKSGKKWWRLSITQSVSRALNTKWFQIHYHLISLEVRWKKLNA